MIGRMVRIRPVELSDVPALHALIHKGENLERYCGGTPIPEDDYKILLADANSHMIVEGINTGKLFGYITTYKADQKGLTCRIAAVKDPDGGVIGSVSFAEGFALLFDMLFDDVGMRKLYFEAFQCAGGCEPNCSCNARQFIHGALELLGDHLQREGNLQHHRPGLDLNMWSLWAHGWRMCEWSNGKYLKAA
jgi:hypothetical protein